MQVHLLMTFHHLICHHGMAWYGMVCMYQALVGLSPTELNEVPKVYPVVTFSIGLFTIDCFDL